MGIYELKESLNQDLNIFFFFEITTTISMAYVVVLILMFWGWFASVMTMAFELGEMMVNDGQFCYSSDDVYSKHHFHFI